MFIKQYAVESTFETLISIVDLDLTIRNIQLKMIIVLKKRYKFFHKIIETFYLSRIVSLDDIS